MSFCTPREAMLRVEGATRNSPIVIRKCTQPGKVEAFFGGTIYGHRVIEEKGPLFVGSFDNTMDLKEVADIIREAACPDRVDWRGDHERQDARR